MVPTGGAQPLWFGFDVPSDATPGTYRGRVRLVELNEGYVEEVAVVVAVSRAKIEQHGDSELWRHSRLRWLDSTAGEGPVLERRPPPAIACRSFEVAARR